MLSVPSSFRAWSRRTVNGSWTPRSQPNASRRSTLCLPGGPRPLLPALPLAFRRTTASLPPHSRHRAYSRTVGALSKHFAKGSILLQSAHVSTLPASPGSLSAFQLVSSLLRKAEGGLSTCCEINHFEKRCKPAKSPIPSSEVGPAEGRGDGARIRRYQGSEGVVSPRTPLGCRGR
jgi:hypothetical protein